MNTKQRSHDVTDLIAIALGGALAGGIVKGITGACIGAIFAALGCLCAILMRSGR